MKINKAQSPKREVLILECNLATLNLTSSMRSGARGFFVGYSSSGLPLYNLSQSQALHDAGQSIARTLKDGLSQILGNTDSRRIFYFLLLNLCKLFSKFVA